MVVVQVQGAPLEVILLPSVWEPTRSVVVPEHIASGRLTRPLTVCLAQPLLDGAVTDSLSMIVFNAFRRLPRCQSRVTNSEFCIAAQRSNR